MLCNYELVDISIGTIESGKVNAGQKYVSGTLKNLRKRMARPRGFTLFREMDSERFDLIVNAFPTSGTDPRPGHNNASWNGNNASISPADFKYEEAIKKLKNADGFDALLFDDCEYETFPLPGLYCRRFTQDMGGYKKGDWVMEPDGKHISVIDEISVLTMKYPEDGSYVEGWDAKTQAKSLMKQLVRLEDLSPEDKAKVANRYLEDEDVRVPQDGIEDK